MENYFEKLFHEHDGHVVHKWNHYFEIYQRHFEKYRGKKIVLLEIGVYKGGSIELWRKFFGPQCQIIGIDINPLCKQFEDANTRIFIGDQGSKDFWRELKKQLPPIDIVIDDGGHMMDQLRITFDELYHWVADDGVYLVEDLHTCYWPAYQGGYKRKKSFIEYCKTLVDQLNAWHCDRLPVDTFTRSTHAMHFYDSVVVFEKRQLQNPFHLLSGRVDDAKIQSAPPQIRGRWNRVKNRIYSLLINQNF